VIDVRRMQALAQEVWRLEGPLAPLHVGDLAWQAFSRGPGDWRVRFWERDGRDVAWGWAQLPKKLDSCVHPDHRDDELLDELIDWYEAESEGDELLVWAQSTDGAMLAALERGGYVDIGLEPMAVHHIRIENPPAAAVPDGFRLRTVEPDDLAARVDLHRIVWKPSRVTEETYAELTEAWPYRTDLDCVVEAPDGRLAAYCLAWLDEANAAGELEPVGTHPNFRRLGLAASVCRFALQRLAEEGTTQAVVYAFVDPRNPGPRLLYESIGFREVSRALRLVKRR
jgi:ribosomal protein S18 acetylase RimI-like enzyme